MPEQTKTTNICDCELSHNGLGISGRECDCPAGKTKTTPFCASHDPFDQNYMPDKYHTRHGDSMYEENLMRQQYEADMWRKIDEENKCQKQ